MDLSSSPTWKFDLEKDRQTHCTNIIYATECLVNIPFARFCCIYSGIWCLKCFGVENEAELSIDAMRGNDGSIPSCSREIVHRWAGRHSQRYNLLKDDLHWLLLEIIFILKSLFFVIFFIVFIHSIVALSIYGIRGCGTQNINYDQSSIVIYRRTENIAATFFSSCPPVARVFSYRTTYYTIFLPMIITIGFLMILKFANWIQRECTKTKKEMILKKEYE